MSKSPDGSVAIEQFRNQREQTGFASRQSVLTLMLLTLVYICVALDRGIISVLLDPIKHEFSLNDSQLGLLPLAFSLFFVAVGVPLGMLADRYSRRTIIATSLLAFSVATALCGAAQNFFQLLLARIGVGAGEAGSGPAAMSIISDLFPESQRASALAFYYLATPLGIIITFVLGGYLVGIYGWRLTFVAAGVPGVILAALLFFLREPARGVVSKGSAEESPLPALGQLIGQMWRRPALRHLTIGITLNAMVSAAILIWCAPFLLRSHNLPVAQAGLVVGVFYGGVSILGVLSGGLISDRLAKLGVIWRTRVLGGAALLSAPALLGLMIWPTTSGMIACFMLWAVISSIWYGPAYGLTQSLVPVRRRATLASLLYLLTNLIGVGFGPQLVGIFSDLFVPHFATHSLRYAMALMALIHLWAMWHFFRAGRTVEGELAEVAESAA